MVSLLPGDVAYAIAGQDATPGRNRAYPRGRAGTGTTLCFSGTLIGSGVASMVISGPRSGPTEPVLDAIFARLPVTIELMIMSQIMAILLAIPLGLYSAYRAGSAADRSITTIGLSSFLFPASYSTDPYLCDFAGSSVCCRQQTIPAYRTGSGSTSGQCCCLHWLSLRQNGSS